MNDALHLHPIDWGIVGPALMAALLILSTHVPLGRQVLRKGIVFIDLAIAQIAGLGLIAAHTLGWEPQGWAVQATAMGAAAGGRRGRRAAGTVVGPGRAPGPTRFLPAVRRGGDGIGPAGGRLPGLQQPDHAGAGRSPPAAPRRPAGGLADRGHGLPAGPVPVGDVRPALRRGDGGLPGPELPGHGRPGTPGSPPFTGRVTQPWPGHTPVLHFFASIGVADLLIARAADQPKPTDRVA